MDSVIVRNYKNQPVRLSAIKVTPEYVVVAGTDRSKTIGFPRDCVFTFDAALFERLRKAFQEGSVETLTALWSEAKLLE